MFRTKLQAVKLFKVTVRKLTDIFVLIILALSAAQAQNKTESVIFFETFSGYSFPLGWKSVAHSHYVKPSTTVYEWKVIQGAQSKGGDTKGSAMNFKNFDNNSTPGTVTGLNVWALSNGIKMYPGFTYTIRFYQKNVAGGTANLELILNTVQDYTKTSGARTLLTKSLGPKSRYEGFEYVSTITVTQETTYYLGLGITGFSNKAELSIDEISISESAGPMRGLYTVGEYGDFIRAETAVYHLNKRGIADWVTFNHTNPLYEMEPNDKLVINAFGGAGTYPVTFKAATPGSATITGSSDKEALVRVNMVNNIHFSGLKLHNSSLKTPWGIHLSNTSNSSVTGCTLSAGSETGNTGARGIYIEAGSNNSLINNQVHSILGTGVDVTTTITDNMLANPYGIVINGGTNHKIYNNSVSLTGQKSVNNSVSAALAVGLGTTGLDVRNNILANTQITNSTSVINTTNYAVYSLADQTAFAQLNYNLYHAASASATAVNFLGYMANVGNAARLQNWKAASAQDKSSMFGQPAFVSTSDLSIDVTNPRSWFTNGTGVQLAAVPKDMNEVNRSISVVTGGVDLGALEFTPTAIAPDMVVTGTRAAGQREVFTFAEREMAAVTWSTGATNIPVNFGIKYRPGQFVKDFPNGFYEGRHMNSWMEILNNQPSSTPTYGYDFEMFYDEALLGGLPEKAIEFALTQKDTPLDEWRALDGVMYNFIDNKLTRNGILAAAYFVGSDKTYVPPTPLPVELLHMTVKAMADNTVKLSWSTATEINSYLFQVERSSDGKNFSPIGVVNAAGTTSSQSDYSFTDRNPLAGTSYYRLQQVDWDNTTKYLPVRSVYLKGALNLSLNVYPNPAQGGQVNLRMQGLQAGEEVNVLVTDLMGVSLLHKKLTAGNNTVLAAGELKAGTYLVKVVDKAGVQPEKIIVNY